MNINIKNITIFVLGLLVGCSSRTKASVEPALSFSTHYIIQHEMNTKKCSICGEIKLFSEFCKHKGHKYSLSSQCRVCKSEIKRTFYRTKCGLISSIHTRQKAKSRQRGHSLPSYTKQELENWCFSQKLFHELFKKWTENNYEALYVPSVDRINDYLPYTIDNIQLMTWNENNSKAYLDRKNGINNKVSKAVIGTNKITGEETEFCSACYAGRKLKISQSTISACCIGKLHYNSAGAYTWRFKNKIS